MNKDTSKPYRDVSSGNDLPEGDARDEERVDKDEDLKTGNDNESPLAKSEPVKKHRIMPDSLSTPDPNGGHNQHTMDEHEQRDPTESDVPDLKTDYPGEKNPKRK